MMRTKALFLLVAVTPLVLPMGAVAQDEVEGMEAGMATMMKYAAPGEHHGHLAQMAGSWTAETTLWMVPGQEPTTSTATAMHEMILDGRFLSESYEGSFMGMAFKGRGLSGYDNMKEKYIGTWVDSMGTMMLSYEGECSDDGATRVMWTEMFDPMSGQMMKSKSVYTMKDADHYLLEMYVFTPAGEIKTLEINHTRAK